MVGMGKVYRGQKLPKGRMDGVGIETEVGTTKGWVCWVTEKDNDWLGSSTGPHTKEVWMKPAARMCNKALISYGYK
jgi:hypothetical protein